MRGTRVRELMACALILAGAACGGGSSEPSGGAETSPSAVAIVSGNGQTGLVGAALSAPLTVKVTTSSGTPVSGASVTFAVTSGAATVSPTTATTDASGVAKTNVTLGSSAGTVQIKATVTGTSLSTTFSVTAGTGTIAAACTSSSPQSPAVGAVQAGLSGTGICLSGGTAGADYALIAFNSDPDTTLATKSFTVRGTGTTALSTPDVANLAAAPAEAPLMSPLRADNGDVRTAFDMRLRDAARRELTPLLPAARQAYRSGARFSTIPSNLAIGQTITLNANGQPPACSNPINVRARVVAISTNAIIVADSANPAGGFTDAEYASFATTFDTLVNPVDINNFGTPSDIDNNGKVLILFTKEVNKLTPKGSGGGFIGGFFFERDLFPTVSNTNFQGCATSNQGEMFYLLAPDPTGIYSDIRKKSDVLNNTIGTLAHEYQHLINAGRRMYVNNADNFESVWLNEGLSHIAEELLYYRATGYAPRQNLGLAEVAPTGDTLKVHNFNEYQADNFGRYQTFLGKPTKTGVYADNDSLETRGATWNMLRYLADHLGSSDADTWKQLVNSTTAGTNNLSRVFGTTWMTQIRDWATSVFTDDIPTVTDARFQEPSWNMRNIFPQLCANSSCSVRVGKLPLALVTVTDASPANLSVVAGGAAYIRFTVPANTSASVDWNTGGLPVSGLVQFTLVRTR